MRPWKVRSVPAGGLQFANDQFSLFLLVSCPHFFTENSSKYIADTPRSRNTVSDSLQIDGFITNSLRIITISIIVMEAENRPIRGGDINRDENLQLVDAPRRQHSRTIRIWYK